LIEDVTSEMEKTRKIAI